MIDDNTISRLTAGALGSWVGGHCAKEVDRLKLDEASGLEFFIKARNTLRPTGEPSTLDAELQRYATYFNLPFKQVEDEFFKALETEFEVNGIDINTAFD